MGGCHPERSEGPLCAEEKHDSSVVTGVLRCAQRDTPITMPLSLVVAPLRLVSAHRQWPLATTRQVVVGVEELPAGRALIREGAHGGLRPRAAGAGSAHSESDTDSESGHHRLRVCG